MSQEMRLALPKGKLLESSVGLFRDMGLELGDFLEETPPLEIKREDLIFYLVRHRDVPRYISLGAADLGICGLNLLLENHFNRLVEPLDLELGKCRMMRIIAKGKTPAGPGEAPRVASKYPNIARRFYTEKQIPARIVKLSGSVELALLNGLADEAIDLVQTGRTIASHGLVAKDEVAKISARLLVERSFFVLARERVGKFLTRIGALD